MPLERGDLQPFWDALAVTNAAVTRIGDRLDLFAAGAATRIDLTALSTRVDTMVPMTYYNDIRTESRDQLIDIKVDLKRLNEARLPERISSLENAVRSIWKPVGSIVIVCGVLVTVAEFFLQHWK